MYFNGLVQDCSNSIANALELLQSCTKPMICSNDADRLMLHTLRPNGTCTDDFLKNLHKRRPIVHPLGRDMVSFVDPNSDSYSTISWTTLWRHQTVYKSVNSVMIIPPRNIVVRGVYWFYLVRSSVRLLTFVRTWNIHVGWGFWEHLPVVFLVHSSYSITLDMLLESDGNFGEIMNWTDIHLDSTHLS